MDIGSKADNRDIKIERRIIRLFIVIFSSFILLVLAVFLPLQHLVLRADMAWNVFLALVPLVAALLAKVSYTKGKKLPAAFFLLLWLAFLPNGPYMITDLIHVGRYDYRTEVGYLPSLVAWSGMLHIGFSVIIGSISGFLALYVVHYEFIKRAKVLQGWLFCSGVAVLCGVGIFIGRFLRFNSWDIVLNPKELLVQIVAREPLHMALFILLFTGMTFGGYLLFYWCFDPGRELNCKNNHS